MTRAHASLTPLLSTRGLTKRYARGVTALDAVDIDVRPGEFIAIIGASGAGKSTLLRCLNRLIDPTEGTVTLGGRDVTRVHGSRLRTVRRSLGMIFQQFNLVGRLTVIQNVLTGRLRFAQQPHRRVLSLARRFPASDRRVAVAHLETVGLADFADARVDELSGGQQQRVAIARVLAQEPDVVLADEPIASLDPMSAATVMRTLARTNADYGLPVLANLHHVDVARRFATRVIGLRSGRLVFDGPPCDLDEGALAGIYGGAPEDDDSAQSLPERVGLMEVKA